MKKILKNLHIIGRDRAIRGDIGVDGDRIAFVGEVPVDFEGEVFDFSFRTLAFPGLFNAHTHLSMVLLRNYADGLPLMEWLQTKIWPVEEKLTPEDIYYGALLGMAELIRSGCTGFRDMYDHMDRVADATIESGLRGVIGQGMIIMGDSDFKKLERAGELTKMYGDHPRIKVEVAPHAPYTCTDAALAEAAKRADELTTTLHIHLSESDDEYTASLDRYGMSPTRRMKTLGILGPMTAAAHCAKMSEEDLQLLAESGTSVLLNPSSNLKLGNGIAPARQMHEKGINIAIGTDGASSNNNLNMLEELHLASLLYGLSAEHIFEAATLGGAKSAQYADLGLISEGYLADIAFLDLSGANLTPHGELISAICYSAAASDISDLMVAGEFVMRGRRILTFDEEYVKSRCREAAERLVGEKNDFRQAGLGALSGSGQK